MQRSLILIYGFNDITNKQKANGALIDSTTTFIVLTNFQFSTFFKFLSSLVL